MFVTVRAAWCPAGGAPPGESNQVSQQLDDKTANWSVAGGQLAGQTDRQTAAT